MNHVKPRYKKGKETAAEIMAGRVVYAVNPVMKFKENAPAIRMFVGFDETRMAEAIFAAWNCEKRKAVGSTMPHTRVKSADIIVSNELVVQLSRCNETHT